MGCLDSKPKNRKDSYKTSNHEIQENRRQSIPNKKASSKLPEQEQHKPKVKAPEDYNHLQSNSHNSHNQMIQHKHHQAEGQEEDPKARLHHSHYNQPQDLVEQMLAPSSSHRERRGSGEAKGSHVEAGNVYKLDSPKSNHHESNGSPMMGDIPQNSKLFPRDADPALDMAIPEMPQEQNDSKKIKDENYNSASLKNSLNLKANASGEQIQKIDDRRQQIRPKNQGNLPIETSQKNIKTIQQRPLDESRNLSYLENTYPEERTLDSFHQSLQIPLFQLILD